VEEYLLILQEATAIGVGFSHASLGAVETVPAHGSVTRRQPNLGRRITPGNWGEYSIGEEAWNGPSPKGAIGRCSYSPPEDGPAAH